MPATQIDDEKNEILSEIHKMRLSTFGERAAKKANDEKPYLPMLHNDEKKMIME
jgi:hypothetical protein